MIRLIGALIMCLVGGSVLAGPWLDVDDVRIRSDIEFLSEIGIVNRPLSVWPIMWSGVVLDIKKHENTIKNIDSHAAGVIARVKSAAKKAESNIQNEIKISMLSNSNLMTGFGVREKHAKEIYYSNEGVRNRYVWKLALSATQDKLFAAHDKLEGSYIAGYLGNWVFGAGSINRWWGSGYQDSLILTNNALPSPGVFVQRNVAKPFKSRLLSWMGPWSVSMFANQLESQRSVSHAKLVGAAISLKPSKQLDVSFLRVAQWGGQGRQESASNFWSLVAGWDNCDENGLSCENKENEPGNQLAGVDIKWRPFRNNPLSLYYQFIGEDEAGGLPSRGMKMFGLSSALYIKGIDGRVFIEKSDTLNEYSANLSYNHSIYKDGYRYEGVSIGSIYDNDAEIVTMGVNALINKNNSIDLRLSHGEINVDGSGINSVSQGEKVDFEKINIDWSHNRGLDSWKFGVAYENDYNGNATGGRFTRIEADKRLKYKLSYKKNW
jgi:hypothetical protein